MWTWKYILVILCLSFFICGCSSNQVPDQVPDDFNFSLRYGVQGKNILSTFDNTFTKDMVTEEPITIKLKLTEKDLQDIFEKMQKINITSYPEVYKPDNLSPLKTMVSPYQTYELVVNYDGNTKKILWEDENLVNTNQANNLRALIANIIEIVQSKEEYKKLPQPKGGYL